MLAGSSHWRPHAKSHKICVSVVILQVSREDAGRLEALESEVEAAQKELVKLESSTSQLQGQATALQKNIEGVGGPQMAKQRALIAKLMKVRGTACDTPRAGHLGECVCGQERAHC